MECEPTMNAKKKNCEGKYDEQDCIDVCPIMQNNENHRTDFEKSIHGSKLVHEILSNSPLASTTSILLRNARYVFK